MRRNDLKHRVQHIFYARDGRGLKKLYYINYLQCDSRLGGAVSATREVNDEGGATDRQLYRLRRWFTFSSSLPLLSESWLLLIIRCHHSTAIAFLLLLLLLGWVEAVHLNLLVAHVIVIGLLIRIHWRRRLHHLAGILKCAHASVAHDLTAMTAELRVLSDWRRLMSEILLSLESIALITWPQHESLLIWWDLQVELTVRTQLVQFRWFHFLSHTRRVIFQFSCDCRVDEKSDSEC